MIAGQADDVSLEADDAVTVERCLRMMADKTGALLAGAAGIGAILAEGPERSIRSLERFGMHLGLAFQAVDDLLGIWGDPAATGKPAAGDLRERKKSLPVAAALETNVTMDAEDLLLRQFLGIRTEQETRLAANWIRQQQRADGTWANFFGGPADLSTTVESYVALRLAGDPVDAAHMREVAAFIRDAGGLERTRVFTHLWLALFGLWSWDDVPALPPEVIFLPEWFPLNVYDFACWARQTIVALTVVRAHRPVRAIGFGIDELRTGASPPPWEPLSTWKGKFRRLDRALRAYERRPVPALRRLALARATEWIVRRQEADGSWGGIQPPWVYSLMALSLQGYPLEHAVMRAGLEGLDRFTITEGDVRRLEACQSPAWDTAL